MCSTSGIGLLLMIGSILAMLAVKDAKVPARIREWLKRCCWGMEERFYTFNEEVGGLQTALGQ